MTAIPVKQPVHWPKRLKYIAYRILRFLVVLYISVCVVFYLIQRRLIFAGADSQGQPLAMVQPSPDMQLLSLPGPGGDHIAAVFAAAQTRDGRPFPDAAHAPTLMYFYGNGMCMNDTMNEIREYRRLGANVIVPEYVGYGMSSGKPSEDGCYAAADAAWHWLETQPNIDSHKIIAMGWSMGAAIAVDVAARKPVAGLAMLSAFTSMEDMGKKLYAFLPVRLILKYRFDSLEKIPRVTCPIVIGHGVEDDHVPYYMSGKLTAAAKAPVTRFSVEGAHHNDFLVTGDEQVKTALSELIEKANNRSAITQP